MKQPPVEFASVASRNMTPLTATELARIEAAEACARGGTSAQHPESLREIYARLEALESERGERLHDNGIDGPAAHRMLAGKPYPPGQLTPSRAQRRLMRLRRPR